MWVIAALRLIVFTKRLVANITNAMIGIYNSIVEQTRDFHNVYDSRVVNNNCRLATCLNLG